MKKEEFNKLSIIEQLKKIKEDPKLISIVNEKLRNALKFNDFTLYPKLEEKYKELKLLLLNNDNLNEIHEAANELKIIEETFNISKNTLEINNNVNDINIDLKEKLFYELTKNDKNMVYLNAIYTANKKSDNFNKLEMLTNYKLKFYHDTRTYQILKKMEYLNKEEQEKIKRYFIYYKIKLDKFLKEKELFSQKLTLDFISEKNLKLITKRLNISEITNTTDLIKHEKLIIEEYKNLLREEFFNNINLEREEFFKIEEELKLKNKESFSEKEAFDNIINEMVNKEEKVLKIDNKIRLYQHKYEKIIDDKLDTMLVNGKQYSLKGLNKNQKIAIYDSLSILEEHSKNKTLKILTNTVPIMPLFGDFDFLKEKREVREGNLSENDLVINGVSITTNLIEKYDKNGQLNYINPIKNNDDTNILIKEINKVSDKTNVTAKIVNGKIELNSKDKIVVEVTENGSKITGLNSTFHITDYYYDKLKELYKNNNVIHENDLSNFLINKKIKNQKIYPPKSELFAYYYYDKETNKTKVKYGTKEDIQKFTAKAKQENIIDFSSKDTLNTFFDNKNNIKFDSKKLIEEVKGIVTFNEKTQQKEIHEGKALIIPLFKNNFFEKSSNINKINLRNFYALTTKLEIEMLNSPKLSDKIENKIKKINSYLNNSLIKDYPEDLKNMKLKIKDNIDKTQLDIDYENKNNKYKDALNTNSKSDKIKQLYKNLSDKTSELNKLINNEEEKFVDLNKIDKLQEEINNNLIELQTFLNKELSDDSIEDQAYYKTLKSFFKDKYKSNKEFSEKFEEQFLTNFWKKELDEINNKLYIQTRDYNQRRFDFYKSLLRESNVSRNLSQNMILNYMFLGLPCLPDVFKDLFELYVDVEQLSIAEKIYKEEVKNSLENKVKPALKEELKKTFPFFKNLNSEKLDDFVDQYIKMNIKLGTAKVFSFNTKERKKLKEYVETELRKNEDAVNVNDINTGAGSELDNVKQTLKDSTFKLKDNLNLALITELRNNLSITSEYSELTIQNSLKLVSELFKDSIKEYKENENINNINENKIFLNIINKLEEKLPDIETNEEKKFLKEYFINKKNNYKTFEEYNKNLNKNFNNIINNCFENNYLNYEELINKLNLNNKSYLDENIKNEIDKLIDLKNINAEELNSKINFIIKTTIKQIVNKPIEIDNLSDYYKDNLYEIDLNEILNNKLDINNFNNLEKIIDKNLLKKLNDEDKIDLLNRINNKFIIEFPENNNKIDLYQYFPNIEENLKNENFSTIIEKLNNKFKETNNIEKTNILNLFSIFNKHKKLISNINQGIKSEEDIVKIKKDFQNIENSKENKQDFENQQQNTKEKMLDFNTK